MADFDTKAVSIMLTLNLHHFRNLQDVRAESTGLAALVNDENQSMRVEMFSSKEKFGKFA